MELKGKLLTLDAMEPIAREATRHALSNYSEPSSQEREEWALGKFETASEGVFEIYIPSERPLDAKVISRARVDRATGKVNVEVFLEKSSG